MNDGLGLGAWGGQGPQGGGGGAGAEAARTGDARPERAAAARAGEETAGPSAPGDAAFGRGGATGAAEGRGGGGGGARPQEPGTGTAERDPPRERAGNADKEEGSGAATGGGADRKAEPPPPQEGDGGVAEEPPGDPWFEPLEEDDDDEEEEDFAGGWVAEKKTNGSAEPEKESERGGSVAGGERDFARKSRKEAREVSFTVQKRGRYKLDHGWEDWPILGEGWKRKEVFRRSGFTVGKTDTYYMSPDGSRLRSKIEMAKHLGGAIDLSKFDFKSGVFMEHADNWRKAQRRRKKKEETSSPEGPFLSDKSHAPKKPGTPERAFALDSRAPDRAPPAQQQRPGPAPSPRVSATPPRAVTATPPRMGAPPQVLRAPPLAFSKAPPAPGTPPQAAASSSYVLNVPPVRAEASSSSSSPQRLGGVSVLSAAAGVPPPRLHGAPPVLVAPPAPVQDTVVLPLHPRAPDRQYSTEKAFGALKTSPPFRLSPAGKLSPGPVPISLSPASARSINGEPSALPFSMPEPLVYGCSICGSPFPGMEFLRPGQPGLCDKCRPSVNVMNDRNIVFRKVDRRVQWGQGKVAEEHEDLGFMSEQKKTPKVQKKTKLKLEAELAEDYTYAGIGSSLGKVPRMQRPLTQYEELMQPRKFSIPQFSDSEDFAFYYDDNDIDDGPKKRSRRSCGKCAACLRTTDCRTCDFCMDKPKFGGRNKKRQKCRLRQCQVEAMRHLLPFQRGQTPYMPEEGWLGPGRNRSRPHAEARPKRSRAGRPRKGWAFWEDFEFTNDEDEEDEEGFLGTLRLPEADELDEEEEDGSSAAQSQMGSEMSFCSPYPSYGKPDSEELYVSSYQLAVQEPEPLCQRPGAFGDRGPVLLDPRVRTKEATTGVDLDEDVQIVEVAAAAEPEVQEVTPVITQIFSLAGGGAGGGTSAAAATTAAPPGAEFPPDHELLRFLQQLRRAVLPAHWVGLAVRGPRLQLLQCSKLSAMADTAVLIEPGFFYQVSVQDRPLLLAHGLYEAHPPRLLSVAAVVSLLQDLERYAVCQGYPSALPAPGQEPVLCARAAACGLLVPPGAERCEQCDASPAGP
ncbi:methyl-CpG-binding domain protein 1-like isoform X2 [Lepisosteus oculatus]|uniref:methyl-CpG-binding domain protein 1-like isoform X2 n=1 Tax=Lepisosteus oculatus TaxID=7918 RepID=UPI0035F502FC